MFAVGPFAFALLPPKDTLAGRALSFLRSLARARSRSLFDFLPAFPRAQRLLRYFHFSSGERRWRGMVVEVGYIAIV